MAKLTVLIYIKIWIESVTIVINSLYAIFILQTLEDFQVALAAKVVSKAPLASF